MDVLNQEQRSKCMAAIRGKDTKPELVVRKLVFGLGYRYRLNSKKVIGKPDLVFFRQRKAIFVHGCFWHMHRCRFGKVTPKTNALFWAKKRSRTALRDKAINKVLRAEGWQICTLWECEIKDVSRLIAKLKFFLEA